MDWAPVSLSGIGVDRPETAGDSRKPDMDLLTDPFIRLTRLEDVEVVRLYVGSVGVSSPADTSSQLMTLGDRSSRASSGVVATWRPGDAGRVTSATDSPLLLGVPKTLAVCSLSISTGKLLMLSSLRLAGAVFVASRG